MKLATWNLQRPTSAKSGHAKALCAEMRDVAADVWVLTETHEDIAPGGMSEGSMSGTPDRPSRHGERWVAIRSRFPIVSRPQTTDSARTAAVCIRPARGEDLLVYATVLPWLGSSWKSFPAKGGVAFAEALAVQHADWRRLQRDYPECDLVVAGDLNQDFSTSHFYGSARNREALAEALKDCGLAPVVSLGGDPIRSHAPNRASVDHICVSASKSRWKERVVTSWPKAAWPPKDLSDHFGLAIEVADG